MLPWHQTWSIHRTFTANSDPHLCPILPNTYSCRIFGWCCNFQSDFISKSNWLYPKSGQAPPTRKKSRTQHIWPTVATVTNQFAVVFAQRLAHNGKKREGYGRHRKELNRIQDQTHHSHLAEAPPPLQCEWYSSGLDWTKASETPLP